MIDAQGNTTNHRLAQGEKDQAKIAAAHGYELGAGAAFNAATQLAEHMGAAGVPLRDKLLSLPKDQKAELVALMNGPDDIEPLVAPLRELIKADATRETPPAETPAAVDGEE